MKWTDQTRTKNSHERLDTLKHLDALGLEYKIDRRGQKTRGWRSQSVKQGFKTLRQSKKVTPKPQTKLRKLKKKQTLAPYRISATVKLQLAPEQDWRGGLTSNKRQLARLLGQTMRQSSLLMENDQTNAEKK